MIERILEFIFALFMVIIVWRLGAPNWAIFSVAFLVAMNFDTRRILSTNKE